MSRAQTLQSLQEADDHVAALRHELAAVESSLRLDEELERRRVDAGAAQQARSGADSAAASAEVDLNALQKRVRDLDRRLYDGSVRNPNELLEMQRELETLRLRKNDAEERALALMESAEAASADERTTALALETREVERAAQVGPLGARQEALRADLDAALAERDSVAGAAGVADVALYQRVAAHRRPAVVRLAGDACGGCHLPVSIEERRAVRTGDGIVQCSNCDRILVA